MRTILGIAVLTLLGATSLATFATAHAGLVETDAKQGVASRFTLMIPHGCGSEATLRVRVRIPAGVVAVKPMPKADWDLEALSGPYETPQTLSGSTLTEGVVEIIWSGTLPDAYYDEFVFRATISEDTEVGSMIYFPTVQECATGVERWIELPKAGHDGHHHLDKPAPGLKVAPAGAHHHH